MPVITCRTIGQSQTRLSRRIRSNWRNRRLKLFSKNYGQRRSRKNGSRGRRDTRRPVCGSTRSCQIRGSTWTFRRYLLNMFLDFLGRDPELRMIYITEHTLCVTGVCGVDCFFFLSVMEMLVRWVHMTKFIHTDNSNPTWRARVFISSRSISMDGSLVRLFSKCHSNGPSKTLKTAYLIIIDHATEVDPYASGCQYAVNNAKVVYNILCLWFCSILHICDEVGRLCSLCQWRNMSILRPIGLIVALDRCHLLLERHISPQSPLNECDKPEERNLGCVEPTGDQGEVWSRRQGWREDIRYRHWSQHCVARDNVREWMNIRINFVFVDSVCSLQSFSGDLALVH